MEKTNSRVSIHCLFPHKAFPYNCFKKDRGREKNEKKKSWRIIFLFIRKNHLKKMRRIKFPLSFYQELKHSIRNKRKKNNKKKGVKNGL